MIMSPSKEYSSISARKVQPLKNFDVSQYESLRKLGISMDERTVQDLLRGAKHRRSSMDAIQPTITTASTGTPLQFLQTFLPGMVSTITGALKADELVGLKIVGEWEDEQIVQSILERTGTAVLYGDYTNVPMSSWNLNYNYRTVVRFEEGMKVGNLEAARAARQQVDDSGAKRQAAAQQLEIQRNYIAFYGFNSGNNNTYGILNEPGLSSYVQVPLGVSGSRLWSSKTFLEIVKDIRAAIVALRTNSQDVIDPETVDITLAIATNSVDFLGVTSDFGISVRDWLKAAYPRVRVTSAPQFNAANGGANVFYMYADRVTDQFSTDGGDVWAQNVQMKFKVMGIQQLAKAYEEDYSSATAGMMLKRPYAVVRYYGI